MKPMDNRDKAWCRQGIRDFLDGYIGPPPHCSPSVAAVWKAGWESAYLATWKAVVEAEAKRPHYPLTAKFLTLNRQHSRMAARLGTKTGFSPCP